jgi:hypothetical protein
MGISNVASNLRPGICTSTTRPTTPYEGQVIYETDTDKAQVWNGSAWVLLSTGTANPPGLELIKAQTLSAVSNDITSVFSSSYDSYKIVVSNFSSGTSTVRTISMRMLSGTTPDTSSNYGWMYHFAYGSNLGGNSSSQGTTGWELALASSRSGQLLTMEITNPFAAAATGLVYQSMTYQNDVTSYIIRQGGGGHNVATSYDGFRIYGVTDSLSGTVRVYGYRN